MNDTHTRPSPDNITLGVVGLGVMGKNLALNMLDHGMTVCGLDSNSAHVDAFITEAAQSGHSATAVTDIRQFLAHLPTPRLIILMVPAGAAVDAVCEGLLAAGAQSDDLVVDCGNSDWQDTERRAAAYAGRLTFFATGISGGEQGARFGPSLMASGDVNAWPRLQPVWQAIAAHAEHYNDDSDPVCAAYVGPGGAGHFVKMVHNGIEYADMQLICEAYGLLKTGFGYTNARIGELFAQWNTGPLNSYLLEISADILSTQDPQSTQSLVDCILDSAGQKGTGIWTVINAVQLGTPTSLINAAVSARALSTHKAERLAAADLYGHPHPTDTPPADDTALLKDLHDALYAAKICAYAQGFSMLQRASLSHGWHLPLAEVARIWRGGCVIRARLLDRLQQALIEQPKLPNVLLSARIHAILSPLSSAWRSTLIRAIEAAVPAPALAASLAYFDGYTSAVLPTQLLQAQRDYFGAHTYERLDRPAGQRFHLHWHDTPRFETRVGDDR